MSAAYLFDMCETVLDAAYNALSPLRTGVPAPSRVFVSHGPSEAHGCPDGQLTVHLEPIQMRYSLSLAASPQAKGGPVVPTAPIVVRLFRCVRPLDETGAVPGAEIENEQTRQMMVDGWALATGLWLSANAGEFVCCNGVQLGSLVPLRSSGAYAGWAITLTVGLSDPGPE
jgi:hypothetical protein